MLLPSALPCASVAPSDVSSPAPLHPRRATRSSRSVSPSPYRSPPPEQLPHPHPLMHPTSSSSLMTATTAGLRQTCHRLHQILSVSRSSPAPVASSTASFSPSRVQKHSSARPTAAVPATPVRGSGRDTSVGTQTKAVVPRVSTPAVRRNRNKRSRTIAFSPEGSSSSSSADALTPTSVLATPRRESKRVRLTNTPPPPPNRGPSRLSVQRRAHSLLPSSFPSDSESNDDHDREEEEEESWSDEEDRQLVEMVLQKLRLTKGDWDECARCLGKSDAKSVGRRWEGLVGSVVLKQDRSQAGRRKRLIGATGAAGSAAARRRRIAN